MSPQVLLCCQSVLSCSQVSNFLSLSSVELGVVGAIGALYPTTGFSAAYILAHEVGHTLGMKHDGIEDGCDWSGFIMSRSRGKHGQTKWSPCSQDKLRSYQATGK